MTIPCLLYKYVWESASEWKWLSKYEIIIVFYNNFFLTNSMYSQVGTKMRSRRLLVQTCSLATLIYRDLCFSYQWIKLGLGSCQLLDSSGRKDLYWVQVFTTLVFIASSPLSRHLIFMWIYFTRYYCIFAFTR